MASLVTGLIDLLGGDPAKTEREQFGNLSESEQGLGMGLATPGALFEEQILSGDPTKEAEALAPEISALQQQGSQAKKTSAEFGTRSGGTASSNANIDASERADIFNTLGGLKSSTASNAVNQGQGFLGQASSNLGEEANLAEQRRQQTNQDATGIVNGAAQLAMAGMGAAGVGGGADPYETLYNAQQIDPNIQTETQSLGDIDIS